jgi:hypothetical protein
MAAVSKIAGSFFMVQLLGEIAAAVERGDREALRAIA